MIKVSVLYPNREGGKFDMDYYCSTHMDLIKEKLGEALQGIAVEQGLGGVAPDSPPTYIAMGHIFFTSVDAFQQSFGPNADVIMADIPNYTDIDPVIQISEVKMD